ncbi:MAG: extracellular solute-binding protein, partial [Candidatus Poseidoniales archaeon]|nr:extracellular solute-binding protein [Candidatus Poseidoniales archaeon]
MVLAVLSAGCIGGEDSGPGSVVADDDERPKTLAVWYTFNADSKEEVTFLAAVADFEAANPSITVEATWVPFENADRVFMTAAQGGEAPDLVRLSNDQLGKIGEVRVDG